MPNGNRAVDKKETVPIAIRHTHHNTIKGSNIMPSVNKADLRRIEELYIDNDYLE
jgi:hypothetical protein